MLQVDEHMILKGMVDGDEMIEDVRSFRENKTASEQHPLEGEETGNL